MLVVALALSACGGAPGTPGTTGRSSLIASGGNHTCWVRADGSVACWGSNSSGESTPPAGVFTQISAGPLHSCARKPDGSVVCWGRNASGESTPPAGAFAAIWGGDMESCGIRFDESAECCGAFTQAGPGQFVQLSIGYAMACGILLGGKMECWPEYYPLMLTPGDSGTFSQVVVTGSPTELDIYGRHNDGTLEASGTTTEAHGPPPAGTFTQLAAGPSHACAIHTDGSVACWGDNRMGQATPPTAGSFAQLSPALLIPAVS